MYSYSFYIEQAKYAVSNNNDLPERAQRARLLTQREKSKTIPTRTTTNTVNSNKSFESCNNRNLRNRANNAFFVAENVNFSNAYRLITIYNRTSPCGHLELIRPHFCPVPAKRPYPFKRPSFNTDNGPIVKSQHLYSFVTDSPR